MSEQARDEPLTHAELVNQAIHRALREHKRIMFHDVLMTYDKQVLTPATGYTLVLESRNVVTDEEGNVEVVNAWRAQDDN